MKNINDRPSEKTIYLWNIIGSLCNALASVLFLVAVTRITGDEESDIFSIAWSIAQLTLTIGTFQVRLFQATDVEGRFTFRQYLVFRFSTIGAMLIASVLYIVRYGYTGMKAYVILALCIYKAFEALSDVYQGWFQQKERLDLAGKGLACRVMLSLLTFIMTLGVSENLLMSCLAMTAVSILCLFFFEIRYMIQGKFAAGQKKNNEPNWFLRLLVTCLPLFINSFLVTSIFNAPKMAIDSAIASRSLEAGMQTIYNIIFMPTSVINLVYIVFRPVITKMAIEWSAGHSDTYLKLMRQVIVKLALIDVVILLGGYMLGIPVLSLVYGVNLGDVRMALMILLLAGGLNTIVNVLDNALTVIRKQYTLVIAYIITWLYAEQVSPVLVKQYGIHGAAMAFLTSMVVLLLAVVILFAVCYRGIKREKTAGN